MSASTTSEPRSPSHFAVVPAPSLVAGHIGALLHDSLGHMTRCHASHGHAIGMRLGPRWLYSFAHPDDIQEIMVRGWRVYSKRTRVYELMVPLLGAGIFTSDGDAWKERRQLAQPAFHTRMLDHFADIMADEAAQLAHRWDGQQQVALVPDLAEIALRIVVRATLGVSVAPDHIHGIREHLTGAIDGITLRVHKVLSLPLWVPTRENRTLNASLRALHSLVDDLIAQRAFGEGALASVYDDGALSPRDLRDDLLTFIFAGHESSATALAWTLYLLEGHPDVARAVRDELSVLHGAPARIDDLPNLPLLDRVVRESLRLYPPQWGLGRNADIAGEIGGTPIPKGTIIGIHPWVTQRSAAFWDDPLAFRPDRWEAPTDDMKRAWLPFGAGSRSCIGKAFAMMEAKIVLSVLLPRWRFDIAEAQPTAGIVLRPDGDMRATLTATDAPLRAYASS